MPLSVFLVAWLVFLVVFAIMTVITIVMFVRYGLSCPTTYITAILFLGMIFFVLVSVGTYFLRIDWSQRMQIFSSSGSLEYQSLK